MAWSLFLKLLDLWRLFLLLCLKASIHLPAKANSWMVTYRITLWGSSASDVALSTSCVIVIAIYTTGSRLTWSILVQLELPGLHPHCATVTLGIVTEVEPGPVVVVCLGGGTADEVGTFVRGSRCYQMSQSNNSLLCPFNVFLWQRHLLIHGHCDLITKQGRWITWCLESIDTLLLNNSRVLDSQIDFAKSLIENWFRSWKSISAIWYWKLNFEK